MSEETYTTIRLAAKAGTIALHRRSPAQEWPCHFCGVRSEETAAVEVETGDDDFSAQICGNCLCTALAIFVGRRHVEEGGELSDLKAQLQ
jgi:hypothetical protein